MAGGVALNCVANGRLLREGPFDEVWIQPAAGDAGGALGVALLIWYQLLDHPRTPDPHDSQHGSLLGPAFQSDEIEAALRSVGGVYEKMESTEQLADCVAEHLSKWQDRRLDAGTHGIWSTSTGQPQHLG